MELRERVARAMNDCRLAQIRAHVERTGDYRMVEINPHKITYFDLTRADAAIAEVFAYQEEQRRAANP